LVDDETGSLRVKEAYGASPEYIDKFENVYTKELLELINTDLKPVLIHPDAQLTPELNKAVEIQDIAHVICVPLSTRGKITGLISVCRTSKDSPFTSSDVELVSVLSGQAAAAIENAHLYEKLEQSYLSMMVALSCVVEARDLYTDKHMKDIAEYSVDIASKIGLAEDEIENIRKAALLHDLGKISIPDHILMKPGKLSEEEIEIIKKHPENGAKIIEPVEPLRNARDIIKYHQECYDGSGYPEGLKGETIPLGARIIAVADAFEAVKEIKRCSGTQFDPDIVEKFIALLKEKGTIKDI
jgi:HD-GYP domain-containing protein (c-di-GMP phosphodiesterase class II)